MVDGKSPIGNMRIPGGSTARKWTVGENSDFDIPSDAEEYHPDEMKAPPGKVVNPLARGETREVSQEEALALRDRFAKEAEEAGDGLSRSVRERVEVLIGFGFSRKESHFSDGKKVITFSLRSLKGFEQKEISSYAENKGTRLQGGNVVFGAEEHHNFKLLCLAYGIEKIDGVDLNHILEIRDLDYDSQIKARIDFIDNFDDELKLAVFNSFEELISKHKKKYLPETAEEVKEATEQVAKSS